MYYLKRISLQLLLTLLIRRYAAYSLKCIPSLIKMSKNLNRYLQLPIPLKIDLIHVCYERRLVKMVLLEAWLRFNVSFSFGKRSENILIGHSSWPRISPIKWWPTKERNTSQIHDPPPFKRRPRNSSDHLKPRLSEKIVILVSDRVLEWTADAINRFQRVWVRDR